MPRCIVKIQGKYAVWSTVVDAPVTAFADSLEALRLSDGAHGVTFELSRAARQRLAKGGSTHPYLSAAALIAGNRAGEGETCLDADALVAQYTEPARTLRLAAWEPGRECYAEYARIHHWPAWSSLAVWEREAWRKQEEAEKWRETAHPLEGGSHE